MVVSIFQTRNHKIESATKHGSAYCVLHDTHNTRSDMSPRYLINGHIACPDRVQRQVHVILGPVDLGEEWSVGLKRNIITYQPSVNNVFRITRRMGLLLLFFKSGQLIGVGVIN